MNHYAATKYSRYLPQPFIVLFLYVYFQINWKLPERRNYVFFNVFITIAKTVHQAREKSNLWVVGWMDGFVPCSTK